MFPRKTSLKSLPLLYLTQYSPSSEATTWEHLSKILTGKCFSWCWLRQWITVGANNRLIIKLGRKGRGMKRFEGIKGLKSSNLFLGSRSHVHSQDVHMLRKELRKPPNSHLCLTLRFWTNKRRVNHSYKFPSWLLKACPNTHTVYLQRLGNFFMPGI